MLLNCSLTPYFLLLEHTLFLPLLNIISVVMQLVSTPDPNIACLLSLPGLVLDGMTTGAVVED